MRDSATGPEMTPKEWLSSLSEGRPPVWWELNEQEWTRALKYLSSTSPNRWGLWGNPVVKAEATYLRLDDIRAPHKKPLNWLALLGGIVVGLLINRIFWFSFWFFASI